jgi:hypothetical protein
MPADIFPELAFYFSSSVYVLGALFKKMYFDLTGFKSFDSGSLKVLSNENRWVPKNGIYKSIWMKCPVGKFSYVI